MLTQSFNRYRSFAILSILGAAVAAGQTSAAAAWQLTEKTDKLAGVTTIVASTTAVADDGARFQIDAACEPGFVDFTLTTQGSATYQQSSTDQGLATFFRTRLDSGVIRSARSALQYTNQATVVFYDPDLAPLALARARQNALAPDHQNPWAKLAADDTANTADGVFAITTPGTITDLRGASVFKLQPTLSNGRTPTLEIDLHDRSLQSVFAQCQAVNVAAAPELQQYKPIQWFNPGKTQIGGGWDQSWANHQTAAQVQAKDAQAKDAAAKAVQQQKNDDYARGTVGRTFVGTVEEFQKALPDFFQRKAAAEGVDLSKYQKELEFIKTHVAEEIAACSQLPTEGAAHSPMYAACRDGWVRVSERSNPENYTDHTRAIFYAMSFYDKDNMFIGYLDKKHNPIARYHLEISFTMLASDPGNPIENMFKDHGIVAATITGSSQAGRTASLR